MAKVDVLLGLQWGDEGKGKVVDFLTPKYDVVARFQEDPMLVILFNLMGKNMYYTKFHLAYSREGTINIIGNGVVLDPITFENELTDLATFNLDLKRSLILSSKAQMIIPTHRLLDAAFEKSKGVFKIESTLRGIGPTYQDKMARVGLRLGDVNSKDFDGKYQSLKRKHCETLDRLGFEYDLKEQEHTFFSDRDFKIFRIINTEYVINDLIDQGKTVLAEGAQGSLIDIDFGSYPYKTSSNTISAGACAGLGVSPKLIGEVFGIFKAYCTRVGGGPFPTELWEKVGMLFESKEMSLEPQLVDPEGVAG